MKYVPPGPASHKGRDHHHHANSYLPGNLHLSTPDSFEGAMTCSSFSTTARGERLPQKPLRSYDHYRHRDLNQPVPFNQAGFLATVSLFEGHSDEAGV